MSDESETSTNTVQRSVVGLILLVVAPLLLAVVLGVATRVFILVAGL